jgi:hypothetical protein
MNSKYMVIVAAMAVMLVGATAFTTGNAFAKYGSQAISQVNKCGNDKIPMYVFCRNTDSQVQGEDNGVALAGAQQSEEDRRGGGHDGGYDNGDSGGYDNGDSGGYDNGDSGGYDNGDSGGYDNGDSGAAAPDSGAAAPDSGAAAPDSGAGQQQQQLADAGGGGPFANDDSGVYGDQNRNGITGLNVGGGGNTHEVNKLL